MTHLAAASLAKHSKRSPGAQTQSDTGVTCKAKGNIPTGKEHGALQIIAETGSMAAGRRRDKSLEAAVFQSVISLLDFSKLFL